MAEIKDIGQLDRRITIQESTTSRDGFGDELQSWGDVVTCWAKVEHINKLDNQEKFQSGRETAIDKVNFTIRYRSGLDAKMRIVYNSNYYNIRAFNEIGRRQFLEITADARDNFNGNQ